MECWGQKFSIAVEKLGADQSQSPGPSIALYYLLAAMGETRLPPEERGRFLTCPELCVERNWNETPSARCKYATISNRLRAVGFPDGPNI